MCSRKPAAESCPDHESLFCKRVRVQTICNGVKLIGKALPPRCDKGF